MPYLREGDKETLNMTPLEEIFVTKGHAIPGDLTYAIYKLLIDYARHEQCFAKFAEALGAVEAAKLEFYRRHVAHYEDKKIEENGDVV